MSSEVLPAAVLENLAVVEGALQDLERELETVLPRCKQDVLEHLNPVDRATAFLQLSRTAGCLFSLYLRTKGISPDTHISKSEIDRVALYADKVDRASYKSTAPSRPTAAIDVQAAGRFIEHAIPDLTEDQRKRVHHIGRVAAGSRKRKGSTEHDTGRAKFGKGLSVGEAAAAFLSIAQKDLLEKGRARDEK